MAHPNIEQRRAYVKQLIDSGMAFSAATMREIGEQFGCSPSAIRADIVHFQTEHVYGTIHINPRLRSEIHKRDKHICQYCGRRCSKGQVVVDHVVPAALGGPARPHNLVSACQSCNTKKKGKAAIPANLEEITKDHPDWREKIIRMATE